MLLCGIINELQERPATNTSYFICQATDSRINTATAVLRGLIRSLSLISSGASTTKQAKSYSREQMLGFPSLLS